MLTRDGRSFCEYGWCDQPPAPERVSQSDSRPYGEYSTGLLNTDGSEKVISRTFLAGLFAQRARQGRVLLYGRLRLGAGRKVIVLQRRVGDGGWTRLARLAIDGRASFQRTHSHRPGAQYRLTYPSPRGPRRSGLAIRPVPGPG